MNKIPIVIEETTWIGRKNEPVTVGIPFPKGFLFNASGMSLFNHKNKAIPLQTKILANWPDKSFKWLLLDFQANIKANSNTKYYLKKSSKKNQNEKISISRKEDSVFINTNKTIFDISIKKFNLLNKTIDDFKIILTDKKGIEYFPKINKFYIETKGDLRTTLCFEGKFESKKTGKLLDFIARLSFFLNSSLVKLQSTVKNTRAAKHEKGFWDLGDSGSVLFKDLSIKIKTKDNCKVLWKDKIKNIYTSSDNVKIYQDSSGGKNWKSSNHVNRNNRVMNSFKGYKLFENNKLIKRGERAEPIIKLKSKNLLSVSIKDFWQNFPKALEANRDGIVIRLFPKQYNDLYELQGGEQKTHTIFIDFDGNDLDWIQDPLLVRSSPEYYSKTKVIPYLTPLNKNDKKYQELINKAIEDKNSFFEKREIIDEYGWRHFGEVYADHEAVHQKGLVSHYNNQYDVIYGAILQYLKSGNQKWFRIANELANHVVDIDIYYTQKDKWAYNGGMFWHTFHYMDAATCTHRSFSRYRIKKMSEFSYGIGGGPANEHNYATGLIFHYFLSGDILSKEAVISLANWVINMDDGSKSKLGLINNKPTGKASCSGSFYYHGPGRGSGNSINVLMDGFELTKNKKYLLKAEELIRRCIHPKEDITKNNLEDVEHRWFYLVFLQALGRFLDLKLELNQKDYIYYYARESLIHYTKWMLNNEVPYKDILHKVDIPTETWPAHDIRKSNIFDYAYKYSPENLSKKFAEKSKYFFKRCINDISTFKTKTLVRPLAIIMNFSVMHNYFKKNPERIEYDRKNINFGKPKTFKPQGYYFYKLRDFINKLKNMVL